MSGASGSTGPLALGNLGAVGLLNNATRGEWLVIWDIRTVSIPNPIPATLITVDLNIGTGQNTGSLTFANSNNSLISFGSALPGIIWTLNVPGNELGNVFHSLAPLISDIYAYYVWPHDWPVCAIAPGDSVIAYSDANPYHDFSADFIYEVVPGGI